MAELSRTELHDYLAFAVDIARQAGEIARTYFSPTTGYDRKDDFSYLTVADTTINDMVIERVKATYPDHDIKGEEASSLHGSDHLWVCDPIDGTAPYVHGLPYSCFELALVIDGVPQVAVVYDFNNDRMYTATKGGGAFCNDQPIHVNDVADIAKSTINESSKTSPYIDAPKLRWVTDSACYRIMVLQCCAQETMLVANGQNEGGVFVGTTVHDVAAPKLIIEEAGGTCTDLFGNDQRYDGPVKGMIYSNGRIHDDLLKLCQQVYI